MAAVSHRDSDQRSIRVALCPTGEGCQPSQPHSESEEIQQPTVTHFQFHSLHSIVVLHHLFQLSDRATRRSKRELESGYPHAEASVTVLASRKVSHLLVRQAFALWRMIFMLSHQFFHHPNVKCQKAWLLSLFRSVQIRRLAAWPSPARCTTCRLRRRSESGRACGTAPCWRFVLVAVCEVLTKWCSLNDSMLLCGFLAGLR